jgi:hypothetical protein
MQNVTALPDMGNLPLFAWASAPRWNPRDYGRASQRLAHRFGVPLPTAGLIAQLAGLGAQGGAR